MTNRLPVIVDFDGTLCEAAWSPERPDERPIGAIKPVNIIKLRELKRAGWFILIYTARPWDDEAVVLRWLRENDVPFDELSCGKPLGAAYIDDLAINEVEASWVPRNAILSLAGTHQESLVTALSSTLSDENTGQVLRLGVSHAKHKF